MAENMVTLIRRGFSCGEFFKHAIVEGARFPEVSFSDLDYADFVAELRAKGYVVPDDVSVEDYSETDTVKYGYHPLSTVLEAEFARKPSPSMEERLVAAQIAIEQAKARGLKLKRSGSSCQP